MKNILRIVAACFALALVMPALSFGSITSQVAQTGPTLITALPQTIPVGFPFQQGADLIVYDIGPSGSLYAPPKTLTLGSDYTITGGGYNGANQMQVGSAIVVSSGAHSVIVNDQIVITRGVAINQTSSFVPSGPTTIALLEQALDKQTTISQELNLAIGNSLRFPSSENLSGLLPLSDRSGSLLAFDTSGAISWTFGQTYYNNVLAAASNAAASASASASSASASASSASSASGSASAASSSASAAAASAAAASSVTINATAVTGLTGGGTNLDNYDDTSVTTNSIIVLSYGNVFQIWKLESSTSTTDTSATPARVRAKNYSTSNRVWFQIG